MNVNLLSIILVSLTFQAVQCGATGVYSSSHAAAQASSRQASTVEISIAGSSPEQSSETCRIRLTDIYDAAVGDGGYWGATIESIKSKYNQLGFNFLCVNTKSGEWLRGLAVRFDETNNIWVKDIKNRINSSDSAGVARLLDKGTHVHNFRSVNGKGFVITEDAISGDEFLRERIMNFCVVRETKGVCGSGSVMRLRDQRSDLYPYALKIIQSIEFLD